MIPLQLFLFIAACVLAAYRLNESKFKGATNWALLLIAVGLILPILLGLHW